MPNPGMTPAGMSAAIKAAMIAYLGTPADDAQLQKFCDAMGNGIVPYVQQNALVNTNDTGEVTSGIAAGDPVVATGVGTVS